MQKDVREAAKEVRDRNGAAKEGDCFHCVDCHKLKSRVNRVMQGSPNKEIWNAMSKEDRCECMATHGDSMRDDLPRAFRETVACHRLRKSVAEFGRHNKFLDKTDLEKKYQAKPEQLANIVAHGVQMACPVRKVVLYADPEYTLDNLELEENGLEEKRTLERTENVKAAKKHKKAVKETPAEVKGVRGRATEAKERGDELAHQAFGQDGRQAAEK